MQEAVDSAFGRWDDAERAWVAIEWALVRDPLVGVPLFEGGNAYLDQNFPKLDHLIRASIITPRLP